MICDPTTHAIAKARQRSQYPRLPQLLRWCLLCIAIAKFNVAEAALRHDANGKSGQAGLLHEINGEGTTSSMPHASDGLASDREHMIMQRSSKKGDSEDGTRTRYKLMRKEKKRKFYQNQAGQTDDQTTEGMPYSAPNFGESFAGSLVDTMSASSSPAGKPSNPPMLQRLQQKHIVVVSAMFGNRDSIGSFVRWEHFRLQSLPTLPVGVNGIMYTDDPTMKIAAGASWQLIRKAYHTLQFPLPTAVMEASKGGKHSWAEVQSTIRRGIMAAKFYKLNAYALPETIGYDIIVWVDAHSLDGYHQHHYQNAAASNVLAKLGNANMMIGRHPRKGGGVAAEVGPAAKMCLRHTKYDGCEEDAKEAYRHELANGFQDKAGLFWCGFFAYWRDAAIVQDFLRQWWIEIQAFSFRDQLSFPYVLSKFTGVVFDLQQLTNEEAHDMNSALVR